MSSMKQQAACHREAVNVYLLPYPEALLMKWWQAPAADWATKA